MTWMTLLFPFSAILYCLKSFYVENGELYHLSLSRRILSCFPSKGHIILVRFLVLYTNPGYKHR